MNSADLDSTRSALEASGVVARSYEANVAAEDAVVATMDRIVRDFGRLDVLINNASISMAGSGCDTAPGGSRR